MKKIFIVTGELSGDKLGAWYLKKQQEKYKDIQCQAVGGYYLQHQGAHLFEKIENLNVVGIIEIIKHLPRILKLLKKISDYILQNDFDEVLLVDFPGFNLRLAKRLKKKNPNLKITYLSPPQIWVWGQSRIKKLKKYFDKLIVLYPFEVEWYKKRGVDVEFCGNPVYSELKEYYTKDIDYLIQERIDANQIAILPGSRNSEIEKFLKIFIEIIKKLKMLYPKIKIILPLSKSISKDLIQRKLRNSDLWKWSTDIKIVQDEREKFKELSKCCLAISKPGTISLQLALLAIPTVIFFKTSWLTYFLAKLVVKVKYMALPNLFLPKPVFKEFIQGDCKPEKILESTKDLYKKFILKDPSYKKLVLDIVSIRELFEKV